MPFIWKLPLEMGRSANSLSAQRSHCPTSSLLQNTGWRRRCPGSLLGSSSVLALATGGGAWAGEEVEFGSGLAEGLNALLSCLTLTCEGELDMSQIQEVLPFPLSFPFLLLFFILCETEESPPRRSRDSPASVFVEPPARCCCCCCCCSSLGLRLHRSRRSRKTPTKLSSNFCCCALLSCSGATFWRGDG